jgi:hypothetical protein
LYFVNTDNLGCSRNSGPGVFHSYRKSGLVQKFWTSGISFVKIWAGPEILEQVYSNHTENLSWSRISGPGVFHSYRNFRLVQKFWTRCISIIQKMWGGPEILDHVKFIHTENLGWSRNSGPDVGTSFVAKFCNFILKKLGINI